MMLSRMSKPQSHVEFDVALKVQTPVNSTANLCDQDLFSHLCNGNTVPAGLTYNVVVHVRKVCNMKSHANINDLLET